MDVLMIIISVVVLFQSVYFYYTLSGVIKSVIAPEEFYLAPEECTMFDLKFGKDYLDDKCVGGNIINYTSGNKPKCSMEFCFRKCCKLDESITYSQCPTTKYPSEPSHFSCMKSSKTNLTVENILLHFRYNISITTIGFDKFGVITGYPCRKLHCNLVSQIISTATLTNYYNSSTEYTNITDLANYCVDIFENPLTNTTEIVKLQCFQNHLGIFYRRISCISLVSFFVTFLVYSVLPELRNTCHGLYLISHLSSLIIVYSFLARKQYYQYYIDDYESFPSAPEEVILRGKVYFLCYYTGFLWMNVICYDIWRSFRSMMPVDIVSNNRIEVKRFIFYSIYAWCTPFLFLFIDRYFHQIIPPFPDLCFMVGTKEQKCVYFYVPLGIILLVNTFFYFDTIRTIKKNWVNTVKLQENRRKNSIIEIDFERLSVYVRLFIVMGVSYLLEIISFKFGGYAVIPNPLLSNMVDVANSLRGLFMFFLFVVKKRLLLLLYNRYWPFKCMNPAVPSLLCKISRNNKVSPDTSTEMTELGLPEKPTKNDELKEDNTTLPDERRYVNNFTLHI